MIDEIQTGDFVKIDWGKTGWKRQIFYETACGFVTRISPIYASGFEPPGGINNEKRAHVIWSKSIRRDVAINETGWWTVGHLKRSDIFSVVLSFLDPNMMFKDIKQNV